MNTDVVRQRERCRHCLQPDFSCYCSWLEPFSSPVEMIILTHPIEVKRRIATGRMAHLTLRNSRLIMGHDYSRNSALNEILADPGRHCVMLYPGRLSRNLSAMGPAERFDLVPE